MKVKIKRFDNISDYKNNISHIEEEIVASIGDALEKCKQIVLEKRSSLNFVGFVIETTKGVIKHKVNSF